jgi:hypothetical protein
MSGDDCGITTKHRRRLPATKHCLSELFVQIESMILRLLCTAALIFPAALAAQDPAATPAAEKRELKFHRPETKGAKYEFSAKASQTRTMDVKIDDEVNPAGSESIDVVLEGSLEVTEVTPKAGNVAGYTLTVKKMTLTDGKGEDEGFDPGTVITAKVKNFEGTYFVHGGEVQGSLKEGLDAILPGFSGMDEPVDETFGPKGPVAPGDKWEPDKKEFGALFNKARGMELDAANSKASASYKGPATVAGLAADTVVTSQTFAFSRIPELPGDAKLVSGSKTYDASFSLARDAKISAALQERGIHSTEIRYTMNREGKDYEVTIKVHSESRRSMTPVK